MEAFEKPHLSSVQCPGFCTVQECGDDNGPVNFDFGGSGFALLNKQCKTDS